jgi:hypothetical protein
MARLPAPSPSISAATPRADSGFEDHLEGPPSTPLPRYSTAAAATPQPPRHFSQRRPRRGPHTHVQTASGASTGRLPKRRRVSHDDTGWGATLPRSPSPPEVRRLPEGPVIAFSKSRHFWKLWQCCRVPWTSAHAANAPNELKVDPGASQESPQGVNSVRSCDYRENVADHPDSQVPVSIAIVGLCALDGDAAAPRC